MAFFKISKGANKTALDQQPLKEGNCWFTAEDGKFYVDISQNNNLLRIPLNAEKADCLKNTRTIQVDLTSKNNTSFDGSEDITPGVMGILSLENGGTGAADAASVRNNLDLNYATDQEIIAMMESTGINTSI